MARLENVCLAMIPNTLTELEDFFFLIYFFTNSVQSRCAKLLETYLERVTAIIAVKGDPYMYDSEV